MVGHLEKLQNNPLGGGGSGAPSGASVWRNSKTIPMEAGVSVRLLADCALLMLLLLLLLERGG